MGYCLDLVLPGSRGNPTSLPGELVSSLLSVAQVLPPRGAKEASEGTVCFHTRPWASVSHDGQSTKAMGLK